jgi:hypothetical protein
MVRNSWKSMVPSPFKSDSMTWGRFDEAAFRPKSFRTNFRVWNMGIAWHLIRYEKTIVLFEKTAMQPRSQARS